VALFVDRDHRAPSGVQKIGSESPTGSGTAFLRADCSTFRSATSRPPSGTTRRRRALVFSARRSSACRARSASAQHAPKAVGDEVRRAVGGALLPDLVPAANHGQGAEICGHVRAEGGQRAAEARLDVSVMGTCQGGVRRKHLPRYLAEFEFRFNRRSSRKRGLLFQRLLSCATREAPPYFWELVGRENAKVLLSPAEAV